MRATPNGPAPGGGRLAAVPDLIGIVQATFVLTMVLPILPALHPRMANEQYGPTVVRQLEPPGFLGLHYGVRTPISILIAHAIFGAILGAFYVLK